MLLPALASAWLVAAGATDLRPQYAVIVANNSSNDRALEPLRYADDDGAKYYELFAPQTEATVLLSVLDAETQALHPGLAAQSLPPTKKELFASLQKVNAKMKADRAAGLEPVLFFVFTGHGKRGAAGEGRIALLGEDLTRSELYEQVLAKSDARFIHLIVDACDSYFLVNSRGGLPTAPSMASTVTQLLDSRTLQKFPHIGVLLSTNSQKESHEWSAIRSGVFSHQVRSALSGAADVNADGRVEYSELRAFVAAANLEVKDPRGKVELFAQPPAQDRSQPIADLTRPSKLRFLMLPAGMAGRFWVEDARGVRIAELNKEAERPVAIALGNPGTHYLRTADREATFELSPAASVVDASHLVFSGRALASRGALETSFRENLFRTAFGPRFYAGYVASTGEVAVTPPPGPDLGP